MTPHRQTFDTHMQSSTITLILTLATIATALVYVRHVAWYRNDIGNLDFVLITFVLILLLVCSVNLTRGSQSLVDGYADAPPDATTTNTPAANSPIIDIVPVDQEAFSKLLELPSQVQTLIEPPLSALIKNAQGDTSDPSNDPDKLEPIKEEDYKEAKDIYVGSVARVVKSDPVGNQSVQDVYTLDPARFDAMKLEYVGLDALLALLRMSSPLGYEQLVGSKTASG